MKRGQGETFMFVYSMPLILIIMILFWFIFVGATGTVADQRINVIREDNNDINLMNYLRTPVEVEGANLTISELIVYSYLNDDFNLLEVKSKEILDPLYQENKCFIWNLDFTLIPKNEKIKSIINLRRIGGEDIAISTARIPLPNTNEEIRVRLFERC